MADLKQLFKTAVASSMDLRGKPAVLGKIDGTLYWSSSRRDMVWARVGESSSFQEMVVQCTKVTPQYDMPVRVDLVNGIMSVVAVDEKRYLEFSGNRPGGNVGAHAWLHGRLGPDPLYITGLQYLPLLVVPTNPAGMTVTVEQGAYRWGGAYKIWERAASGSLAAYVPGSSTVKHFVIICLDRVNNAIEIVDGDDLTAGGGDALFGGITLSVADVLEIAIDDTYLPLAAILLYNGQTEIRAADIVFDLRTWGGEDFVGAVGIPEPDDDGETYGRMTDTGVSSWVAVVPKTGGTFTGTVTISQGAASDWAVFNTTDTSITVHMRWKYNSLDRWAFAKNPEATGSAFSLIRYDDAGAAVDSPLTVSRSTGKVVIGSGTPIAGTHAIYGGATFAGNMGFYGTTAIAQPSGVTASTALENLGLGASLTDEIPEPPNDSATYGRRVASGTPGWRLVVPALGGTFTGAVTISAGGLAVSGGLSVVTSGLTVEGGAVFNEAGADVDHRFEGDNDPNLLVLNGGLDSIGIGTDTPTAYLHLSKTNATTTPITGVFVNNIFAPGSAPGTVFPASFNLQAEYNSSQNASGFQLAQFLDVRNSGNGTISSRNLDIVYRNLGNGTIARVDDIYIRTPINSGGGAITLAHGLYIEAQTIAATNYAIYTNAGQLRFGDGATFGSPTGGYKGSGTVNAQAVYDDNVLLSDYIFDLHYDGRMRPADAERFPNARLWNIEQTAVFTEKNRHLPTMPGRVEWESAGGNSLGQLVTALWETVEQQQLQIFDLNNRLKAVTDG